MSLEEIKIKMYGINKSFIGKLSERLEIFNYINFKSLNAEKWIIILYTMQQKFPYLASVRRKVLTEIYFLDLIVTYRGWRHLQGLPVRGQRTWTNAWSVYKNNLFLRKYKITMAKKIYGNHSTNTLGVIHLAEQVNLLWKLQWENEWKSAKKKRLLTSKSSYQVTNIDLYSMSKGLVETGINRKKKRKMLKKKFSQNLLTLGFEPGFTKTLVKLNFDKDTTQQGKKKQGKINLIFEKKAHRSKKKRR